MSAEWHFVQMQAVVLRDVRHPSAPPLGRDASPKEIVIKFGPPHGVDR